MDEGGLQKEFFQLVIKQLFNPKFGMLIPKNSQESMQHFELLGTIMGLAIYNSANLELTFPTLIYKKLLNEPLILEDLKDIEEEIYTSLSFLLNFQGNDNDIQTLGLTFQIKFEIYGEVFIHQLKLNGDKIPVTTENKNEFVKLYFNWIVRKSIEAQFNSFYNGFWKVTSGKAIKLLNSEELQLLICGAPLFDFHELEKSTRYEAPYHKNYWIIKAFWEIIHSLSLEEQKNFLSFSTGTSRIPIQGFSYLQFTILRGGPDSEILPTAHTCFNHLIIPEYSTQEKLRRKLLLAINNSEGFGLI